VFWVELKAHWISAAATSGSFNRRRFCILKKEVYEYGFAVLLLWPFYVCATLVVWPHLIPRPAKSETEKSGEVIKLPKIFPKTYWLI